MARTIIEVVRERKAELKANPVLATQNMMMAMAAIRDGIRSDAWQLYMSQFVDQNPPGRPVNPDQLLRLTARDGTQGDLALDRQRAYLVANSICGPSTVDTIDFSVETIDYTMDPDNVDRPQLDCETTTLTGAAAARQSQQAAKGAKKKAAAVKGGKKKAAKKAQKRYNS
jgi:hypothetical protein